MPSQADRAPGKYLPLRFVLRPLTEAQCYLVFWISDAKNEHLLLGNVLNLFVGQSLTHLWPCFWCDTALHGRPDPATPQLPCRRATLASQWVCSPSPPWDSWVSTEIHVKAFHPQLRRAVALSDNCYKWSLSSQETNLLRKADGHCDLYTNHHLLLLCYPAWVPRIHNEQKKK